MTRIHDADGVWYDRKQNGLWTQRDIFGNEIVCCDLKVDEKVTLSM